MRKPRSRTVYKRRKWPLPAPVSKIMALECSVLLERTLRYECDKTFSDECEFAARAEGE